MIPGEEFSGGTPATQSYTFLYKITRVDVSALLKMKRLTSGLK